MEIAIISGPYSSRDGCVLFTDSTSGVAIWACGGQAIQYSLNQSPSGFVWAKIRGVYVNSCYAPPSPTLPEFKNILNNLILDLRGRSPKVT